MEQMDMFDIDLSRVQQFFKNRGLEISIGKRYVTNLKFCRVNDKEEILECSVMGRLIRCDDTGIAMCDAWIQTADDGYYADFITCPLNAINKITYRHYPSVEIGGAYRAEIYRQSADNRPTTWLSCYYMGLTMANRVVLVDFGNANNVMVLNKEEIKGFYPLSVDNVSLVKEAEEKLRLQDRVEEKASDEVEVVATTSVQVEA